MIALGSSRPPSFEKPRRVALSCSGDREGVRGRNGPRLSAMRAARISNPLKVAHIPMRRQFSIITAINF